MLKLYLVRHCEAEGNRWRRAHGWYDSDLTLNGDAQAERLRLRMAEELRNVRLDAIYASDLTRTMRTAEAVRSASAGTGGADTIIPDTRLREFAMGDWENTPWETLARMNREKIKTYSYDAEWRAPGAESFAELYARTGAFLQELTARHREGAVCVVSHAVALRTIFAHLLGGGLELAVTNIGGVPYVPNGSVSLFTREDGVWTQVFYGDNTHLAGMTTHKATLPACVKDRSLRPEFWYRHVSSPEDIERAADAWRLSWLAVHGNEDRFSYSSARREICLLLDQDPQSVIFPMLGEETAGALVLDRNNLWEPGCGHIALLMLYEPFRGFGLGPQLIGEAANYYRRLGREFLRLRVSVKNERAIAFYKADGFVVTDYEGADDGGQYIMKRYIGPAAARKKPEGRLAGEGF